MHLKQGLLDLVTAPLERFFLSGTETYFEEFHQVKYLEGAYALVVLHHQGHMPTRLRLEIEGNPEMKQGQKVVHKNVS